MSDGSLQVRASRFYQRWLGGEREIAVSVGAPVALADLLERLAQELPDFPVLPAQDGARLQAEVLIFDGRRFLRPHDIVSPGATIELLPPTAGG